MTDKNPTEPTETPQNPAQSVSKPPEKRRFDPFTHEEDMFKIVLWVGAAVLVVAAIIVIVEAIA
jgi:hypothetical protein